MRFDWDPQKNASNRRKHGFSFESARVVFKDPLAVSIPDPDAPEERWITVGHAGHLGLIVVVHTYWEVAGAERIRIISARRTTRRERRHMKKAKPEMRREYDFSGGVRGKFYRPRKVQKTLRLDADILAHFQARAREEVRGYQTLINEALRSLLRKGESSGDRGSLRRMIAEEVRRELARRKKRSTAA